MINPGKNRPLIFAHRGACKVAPENTLPAFEAAVRLGADGVELDVQYSSDGGLVVFHNPTLDATTNGTGHVTAHTLDELRSLDAGSWFGPEFAGTRIPTLDEALDLLARQGAGQYRVEGVILFKKLIGRRRGGACASPRHGRSGGAQFVQSICPARRQAGRTGDRMRVAPGARSASLDAFRLGPAHQSR